MAIVAQVLKDAIDRLEKTVNPVEQRVFMEIAGNPESSMSRERLAAARELFEGIIKPHYQQQFNAIGGIDAIFTKIKEIILTEIIESNTTPAPTRTWVQRNKAALLNGDPAVVAESQNRLTSITNPSEIAWRNFDSGASIFGQLANTPYGFNLFVGDNQDLEVRERLAYYYLAITDEQAVSDPEERKQLLANFIRILGDIRRKNADLNRPNALDIPSCKPGTLGRLADMGQGHPIAQLWFTIEEALPPFVSARSVEKLKQLFLTCKTDQERKEIIDNLQKPLQEFSGADLNKRNEILKALNVEYSGGSYKLSSDTFEGGRVVTGWVSAVAKNLPQGKTLWNVHEQKILLMLLDPMPYFGDKIQKMYDTLEPIPENPYPRQNLKVGVDFFGFYQDYLQYEKTEAARKLSTMSKAAFLEFFSKENIQKRMIEVSIQQGFQGGNRELTIKAIPRMEVANLLENYTKNFIECKNAMGRNFNYLTCRKQAIEALLQDRIDFDTVLPEELQRNKEERIRDLEAKIKELQAAKKASTSEVYQQLDLRYQFNIAAFAHEQFDPTPINGENPRTNNGPREDFPRHRIRVPNTGPEGGYGPYGATMALPRLPVVHPYNPTGEKSQIRHGGGVPAFILTAALPIETRNNLPPGIRALLGKHGINIENLEIFFCVQDMPWQNAPLSLQNPQLLLRPHPWLHSDAPVQGIYNRTSTILVGISDINGRMTLATVPGISTHGEGADVVYSGQQLEIQGVQCYTQSHVFYSLCIKKETGEAALTLHGLLNDKEFKEVHTSFCFGNLAESLNFLKNRRLQNSDLIVGLETLLGCNPPPLHQGTPRYFLQEQAPLLSQASQISAEIEPSDLERVENSIRSVSNNGSLARAEALLSILETEHARLRTVPGQKKEKGKLTEPLIVFQPSLELPQPEPLQIQVEAPQAQAVPSQASSSGLASAPPQQQALLFSPAANMAAMTIALPPAVNQTPQSEDDQILAELVREAEALRLQGRNVYYVYENHRIEVTETLPRGFQSACFNLSPEAHGQNQRVCFRIGDLASLYGNHGFIHRATEETRRGLTEKIISRHKDTYVTNPQTLQRRTVPNVAAI